MSIDLDASKLSEDLRLLLVLSVCSAGWLSEASAQDSASTSAAGCGDVERCRQAEHLIAQAKEIKREVRRYHLVSARQSAEAQKLLIAAKQLDKGARKLNAGIQENVSRSSMPKSSARQFDLHLNEFKKHSSLYNAHLAEYEKELGKLQGLQAQLRSSCQEYADHQTRYHIPGLRPPHICLQLQWEQSDMQKVVKGYQEDQQKAQKAETALAAQEARLAQAAHERAELETKMLRQSEFDELERTKGFMLLKEYQQIEREYRLLESERKSLGAK